MQATATARSIHFSSSVLLCFAVEPRSQSTHSDYTLLHINMRFSSACKVGYNMQFIKLFYLSLPSTLRPFSTALRSISPSLNLTSTKTVTATAATNVKGKNHSRNLHPGCIGSIKQCRTLHVFCSASIRACACLCECRYCSIAPELLSEFHQ